MKRGSTTFLQVVIVLFGIGTLALLLWEPTIEGRNAHATLFEVYFHDPFLVYAYTGAIPFFVALYQAWALLGLIEGNTVFSPRAVRALRTIQYCALITASFIVGHIVYAFIFIRGKDDIAGGVAIGTVLTFACLVIATAAAVFARLLQRAVDLKSENDLTV